MAGYQKVDESETDANVMHSQDITIAFKNSIDALVRSLPLLNAGGWYYNGGIQLDLATSGTGIVFTHHSMWVPEGVAALRVRMSINPAGLPTMGCALTNLSTLIPYNTPPFPSAGFIIPAGSALPWQFQDVSLPGGDYYKVEIGPVAGSVNNLWAVFVQPLWEN